jgi:elongation factor Ts
MTTIISAADVNKLRQITGAGMMDCKKALTETNGDFEAAIDYLRKKGQKVSEKRADRETNEGIVIAEVSGVGNYGIIMGLGCETDFVAKNEDYINFAKEIAALALQQKPMTKSDLLNAPLHGITVAEKLTEQIGKIGEKIEIVDYALLQGESLVAYNHSNGKVAVLVALNKENEIVEAAGRDIAMQIAAMAPIAIDKNDVPEEVKTRELEIGREQARAEGKPDAILDKIALGKLEAYYKDNTLLNQKFVKDNSKTIKEFLASTDKDLTVTAFKRIALGA